MMSRRHLIFTAGLVLLAAVYLFAPRLNFIFNTSASMPVGLYRHHPDVRPSVGDIVLLHPPSTVRSMVRARGYAPRSGRIQKYLLADAGTRFCVTKTSFRFRSRNLERFSEDSDGRPLPDLPKGCRAVPSNHVLVGTPHPRGFDSRYFGPVSRTQLDGVLTPLFTWLPDST